jgi:hypothetical protein
MTRDSGSSGRSRHHKRRSNASTSSSRRNSKKSYDGLTIFVRRADNLRNGDFLGKSDPYVSCSLAGEVAKTHKIRNTLNPGECITALIHPTNVSVVACIASRQVSGQH